MTKNDAFAQRMVPFALDRGWHPKEEDLAPFMERMVVDLEKWAAFGHQCYQDRCENAYVEQSVRDLEVKNVARRCADLVESAFRNRMDIAPLAASLRVGKEIRLEFGLEGK